MNICNVQESLGKKWHSKHQVLNSADHATSRWSSVFLFLFLFVFLFVLFCYFCFHQKQSKHTNFISLGNGQKV